MRRWHCESCNNRFTAPYYVVTRENLDGEDGWWECCMAYCPQCGGDQIVEVMEDDE